MGYLERIFLGTMALFVTMVLFMFGLYFDLWEMVLGIGKESEPLLSVGEFAYTRAAMERVARPVEIMPRSFGNSDFGVPSSDEEIAKLYRFMPPPPSSQEVIAWWRTRLAEQGVQDPELLEMEALGHDRELADSAMARVNQAVADKDLDGAATTLEEAIRQTDSKNLYVLRDLLVKLSEIYSLLNRPDEAGRAAGQLSEACEKILVVKARAMKSADLTAMAGELAKARSEPPPPRESRDAERAAVKAKLLQSFEEGKLTRPEMDAALERLK